MNWRWHFPSWCFPVSTWAPGKRHWWHNFFCLRVLKRSVGDISANSLQTKYCISLPLGPDVVGWSVELQMAHVRSGFCASWMLGCECWLFDGLSLSDDEMSCFCCWTFKSLSRKLINSDQSSFPSISWSQMDSKKRVVFDSPINLYRRWIPSLLYSLASILCCYRTMTSGPSWER